MEEEITRGKGEMGHIRQVEIAGTKLAIHAAHDTNDPATGRALTGSWLWASALHLAEWMASDGRSELDLRGTTVLELGAGTGLPGLAAAVLGAARVVLTDKPLLLPGLRRNVEANGLGDRVEVREMTWGSDEAWASQEEVGDVDVVLMSDVFFDPEEMVGLGRMLRRVCGERTRVWSASEVRSNTGDCLDVLVREGFQVVELPERSRRLFRSPEESSMFAVFLITPLRGVEERGAEWNGSFL